ncbi:MAG: heavy-metal-associated domain-containing protein [Bacteroidales bacterium]|nr:heavy-metal-associated domain-containing protein [Bacteroidales bacterium]
MNELKIKVTGMSCNHCKMNVENALKKIKDINSVLADVNSGEVTLTGDQINPDEVKSAIENAGYSYGGILA